MNASPHVVAGMISSLVFAASALPMLVKAHRTRDLQSYSLGNLVLINAGNALHTVYVVSLPFGPIWFLHSFYTVSSLAMLGYYLQHARRAPRSASGAPGGDVKTPVPPTGQRRSSSVGLTRPPPSGQRSSSSPRHPGAPSGRQDHPPERGRLDPVHRTMTRARERGGEGVRGRHTRGRMPATHD